MTSKRFFLTFIILLVIALAACKETNQVTKNIQTYEDIVTKLDSQTGKNELLELISIEKTSFNIETENASERRMNFSFLIKNLTNEQMKISYVAYFPNELESYYLSRTKLELEEVDLKPNQVVDASQSLLVAHEEMLSAKQRQFLRNNSHVMYFAFSIDKKPYYVKVNLDKLGFQ